MSMKPYERYRAYLAGKPVDRAPVYEQAGYWHLTLERWISEGMPAFTDHMEIVDYFGLDPVIGFWFHPFTEKTPQPTTHGGGIMETEEDYERDVRHTLFKPVDAILSEGFLDAQKKSREEKGTICGFGMPGPFWYPRNLFGIENHFYSFYDEPELYKRVVDEYADWVEALIRGILSRYEMDFVWFSEDMSYNGGSMISQELFDEFLAPFYRRIVPIVHEYGAVVSIDSDGNITDAVDWYGSVGADLMSPLERQAGVDVSTYIDKQPEMGFVGHFDKMCMKFGEEAMRKEFERLLPSMNRGKLIPSVDHQTPPDVSLENYKIYVSLLKEYAAKIDCSRKGILPCRVYAK